MPEQPYWETLFDVAGVLDRLGIDQRIEEAVEVGCGYGTFTLPVAERIRGRVYAFDIEEAMIVTTRARVAAAGRPNVTVNRRDVLADGFGLPPASIDAVLLFNILHAENPEAMLRIARDVLRPGGRVFVIHWRSDVTTPRGPDLSIRPRPEQIAAWAAHVGLRAGRPQLLPPWHFGLVLDR